MKKLFYNMRLKTKLIILIFMIFILAIIAENSYIIHLVNKQFYNDSSENVKRIAHIVATSDQIIHNIEHPTPSNLANIQHDVEKIRSLTDVEFITVFDMNGIRYSHPDLDKIGKHIVGGDGDAVLHGESYLSTATGTLGRSIRAFHPIYSVDTKKQIGGLMVGKTVNNIDYLASRMNQSILWTLFISLTISICLALWISKYIKNILLGLEPFEMVKSFEERDAIIRTVKEGIVVVNREGRITQINDEAIRILNLSDDKVQILDQDIKKIIPNSRLNEVMLTRTAEYDNELNINGVVILTNRTPLLVKGELVGAIASFRDMTEVRQLAENLTGVNRYADALRSQAHEFNNHLHVIYGMAFNHDYKNLLHFLDHLIGAHEKEYTFISQKILDPIIAGFLTSKFSRARELGVMLHFNIDGQLSAINDNSITHKIITILGNLIDNGLDAVQFLDDKKILVNLTINDKL